MPWARDEVGAGFTPGKPWLPLGVANRARAVDVQEADPNSLLQLTRRFVAFRRSSDALSAGRMAIVETSDDLLAFERNVTGERLLCVFNMGENTLQFQPPAETRWRISESVGEASLARLGPFAAYVAHAF